MDGFYRGYSLTKYCVFWKIRTTVLTRSTAVIEPNNLQHGVNRVAFFSHLQDTSFIVMLFSSIVLPEFPANWFWTVTPCFCPSGGDSGLLLCCFLLLHLQCSCSVTLSGTPRSTSSSTLFACRTTFSPKGYVPVDSAWQSWRTTLGSPSTSISLSTLWWPERTVSSLMKPLNGGR